MKNTSLYPDILFHFTDKNGLYKILENNFRLSYSKENIQGKTTNRELFVPMVSFCDLKLSQLKVHMSKYGKYGIGLSKEWANKNGLNPVMYVNKNCQFTDNFNNALNKIYHDLSKIRKYNYQNEHSSVPNQYLNVIDAYRYMKNYEGKLERNDITHENFRFADEREWRYVPPLNNKEIEYPFIASSNIRSKHQKLEFNRKIEHIKLFFKPNDIKYLIIENDSEINDLINHIRHVKRFHTYNNIDRLSSRILTSEQIENDI
ncbi:abortive infection system antitoxin AbiGi family protein [Aliarcobacter butzleri]|uniref:abortive infection system antitoxin AbiGi family protein n=1 Tax=Aliarcobacter butzleri TaxID=28197 RepID=UPI0021B3E3AC|nr:abortive infection system antitoxin AbiGi family protein [Aliarcobacter butzleri]MCT7609803.1 abortive infection system antitoxin AbiGi family protein [Aliarcobacter butzleri]